VVKIDMKKSTIILSILLLLSLAFNAILFGNVIENSYIVGFHPRLKQDTKILGALLDKNYKRNEISKNIEKHLPDLEIKSKNNIKSMWDWSGPEYPYALTIGGLNFYFDSTETLVRVDHWLQVNSPLYKKNH